MNRRKLFLWILCVSTVVLAVLWWRSMVALTVLRHTHPGGPRYSFILDSGSLPFGLTSPEESYTKEEADALSFVDHARLPPSFSFSNFSLIVSPRTGDPETDGVESFSGPLKFRAEKKIYERLDRMVFTYHILHRMTFPLWFPWLVLNGCALAACRMMERRTRGAEEKRSSGEMEKQQVLGGIWQNHLQQNHSGAPEV